MDRTNVPANANHALNPQQKSFLNAKMSGDLTSGELGTTANIVIRGVILTSSRSTTILMTAVRMRFFPQNRFAEDRPNGFNGLFNPNSASSDEYEHNGKVHDLVARPGWSGEYYRCFRQAGAQQGQCDSLEMIL